MDEEVVIKIAADIAQANEALQTMLGVFEGMAAEAAEVEKAAHGAAEGIDDVGNKSEDSTAKAVTWGTLVAKAIEEISNQIGNAISAFPQMVAAQAAAGEQLNVLANRLNLTADAVRELQYVSALSGVNMNVMAKGMQGLSVALTDTDSRASKAVASLGLIPEELAKMPDKAMMMAQVVEQIRKTVPASEQGAKMIEIFGNKAQTMTGLLKEDLPKIHKEFQNMVDEKAIQDSARLGNEYGAAVTNIKLTMEEFKRGLSNTVLPVVNGVLEALPGIGGAALVAGEGLMTVGEKMQPLVTNLMMAKIQQDGFSKTFADFGGKLAQIGPAMSSFSSQLFAMGKFLLTNPWGILITAATLLIPLLWDMVGGWDGIKKAMEPVVVVFEDLWTIAKSLFGDLVEWVGSALGWLTNMDETSDGLAATFTWLSTRVSEFIEYLKSLPIIGTVVQALSMQFEVMNRVIGLVWDAVKGLFNFIGKVGSFIGGVWHQWAEGIRAAEKASADLAKSNEKVAETTKPVISALDATMAQIAKAKTVFEGLTDAQKTQIKTLLDAGKSSKDVGELMAAQLGGNAEVARIAVDSLKKELQDLKKEAKEKSAFEKFIESANELAKGMNEAAAAGSPLNERVDEFGKKSAEIAQKAALKGALDKIPPSIIEMGNAWLQSNLATEMDKLNKEAEALAKTFTTKLTAAADAAASAVQTMSDDMTESMLEGVDKRLFQIDREQKARLAAIEKQRALINTDLDAQILAIETRRDKIIEAETKAAGVGKTLSAERLDQIYNETAVQIEEAQNQTEAVRRGLEQQQGMIRRKAEEDKNVAKGTTTDMERHWKERGVVTQEALDKEAQTQRTKLAEMLADRKSFNTAQIEAQKAASKKADEEAADDFESQMKRMGVLTKKAAQDRIDIEQKKLDELLLVEDQLADGVIENQRKAVEAAEAAAGKVKTDWSGAISTMATAFSQLAQISGDTFGGMMKGMGQVISQADVMTKGIKSAMGKEGIGGIGKAFGESKGAASGFGGLLKGITGSIPMIGTAIQGVMAAATMAIEIGKKMWDAFTKSPGEKLAKRVEKDFKDASGKALKVSEEFGDKLAVSMKSMFKGDMFAAEIYHLNDIIKEAGGISEKNFASMSGRMRDIFVLVEKGAFTTEQATKVLNDNFSAFADHVVKSGTVANKQFTDLIGLNEEFGTKSKAVMDFVSQQTTRLGSALGTLSGTMTANGDSVARFETLAVGGFNAALAAGVPYIDAINQMSPALDAIVAKHTEMGTKGGAAINELLRFREVTVANQELVEGTGALNEVMLALSNIGGLNVETFDALQKQGNETFEQLTAAGFTEQQSLQQMKGYLENVKKGHKELGLPIDENTEKMLEQAEASGILRKEEMKTNDIMIQGLSAIIEAVGGKVPEAFKTMATAAADTAKTIDESVAANTVAVDTMATAVAEVPFDDFAIQAKDAAEMAQRQMLLAAQATATISTQLDNTDWAGWQSDAVKAANKVKEAVDEVSFGSSPGGIKEIPLQLAKSTKSANDFARKVSLDMANVKANVERIPTPDMRGVMDMSAISARNQAMQMTQAAAAQAAGGGGGDTLNFTFEIKAFDSQDVARAVETQILPKMLDTLRRGRNLTALRELVR